MSSFQNPRIAEIDDALTGLEPCLSEFAKTHGFVLTRSHEGSFNVPHRRLRREAAGINHEIGLNIELPMPDRLERGFFPEIPCTLYIGAIDRATQICYSTSIIEAMPFKSLSASLTGYLLDAERQLQKCTSSFIREHGLQYPNFK